MRRSKARRIAGRLGPFGAIARHHKEEDHDKSVRHLHDRPEHAAR